MADVYQGRVRILEENGVLLGVGIADLKSEPDLGTWSGTVDLVAGSAVAGKALVVLLDTGSGRGRAQLRPLDNRGITAHSAVTGLSPQPF
jgi:hypothetical protein